MIGARRRVNAVRAVVDELEAEMVERNDPEAIELALVAGIALRRLAVRLRELEVDGLEVEVEAAA